MSAEHKNDTQVTSKSTLTNYLSALLELGVFVFHILASRFFGKLAYGAYIFAFSIIELLAKVGLLGFDKSLLKSVAAERIKNNKMGELQALITSFKCVLGSSFIIIGILLLFAEPIARFNQDASMATSLKLLSPLVLCWAGMMAIASATMATRTMRYSLVIRGIINPLAMLLGLGVLVGVSQFYDVQEYGIIYAHVLAGFCVLVLSVYIFGKCFNLKEVGHHFFKMKTNWHLVRYSVPIGFAELLNQALARLDVILLGFYIRDPLIIANYGAIILLSNSISSVRYAFDPVLSPIVSESIETGNLARLEENLKRMVRWVSFLALPFYMVMSTMGDQILMLWGQSYVQAYGALVFLAFGHLFNAVFGLHQWPVVISGRSRLDLINNIVVFIVNLILNVLFIPKWGMMGSAVATTISRLLLRILQMVQVKIYLHMHAFSLSLIKLFVSGILSLVLVHGLRTFVEPSFVMYLLLSVAGLVLYVILIFILGLDKDDKKIVDALWLKLSSYFVQRR
ncbi:polysaccharide biosynthesis C-terminal domain-containing protein [bacterium]|nr:polysaccharide biosynthesis C-terminal domain-containing protein [bacterium]